jgi:hypothetical protein
MMTLVTRAQCAGHSPKMQPGVAEMSLGEGTGQNGNREMPDVGRDDRAGDGSA